MKIGIIGNPGLGLTASHKRNIKNGYEYERYFLTSELEGSDPIIKQSATTAQTVDLMRNITKKYANDTAKLAPNLKGSSLEQTCKNIFNFAYNHFQYKLDKDGVEQLRRPLRSWKDRRSGIDCDCFSILVASILQNLKIQSAFVTCEIDNRGYHQHVYVHVPKGDNYNPNNPKTYFTIDPVLDRFNEEAPNITEKKITMIPVQFLNGLGNPMANTSSVLTNGMNPTNYPTYGREISIFKSKVNSNPLQAVKDTLRQHFINTRALVKMYPQKVAPVYKPAVFLGMLDKAIWAIDQPDRVRDAAFQQLAACDDYINPSFKPLMGYLNGTPGLSGQGLGNWARSAGKWIADTAKATGKAIADTTRKVVNEIEEFGKDALDAVLRYNPVSVAARAGFLLAMKINMFGIAGKVRWGYLTEGEANSLGVNSITWNKSKNALRQIENMWVNVLKGKSAALKEAINFRRKPSPQTLIVPEDLEPTKEIEQSVQKTLNENAIFVDPSAFDPNQSTFAFASQVNPIWNNPESWVINDYNPNEPLIIPGGTPVAVTSSPSTQNAVISVNPSMDLFNAAPVVAVNGLGEPVTAGVSVAAATAFIAKASAFVGGLVISIDKGIDMFNKGKDTLEDVQDTVNQAKDTYNDVMNVVKPSTTPSSSTTYPTQQSNVPTNIYDAVNPIPESSKSNSGLVIGGIAALAVVALLMSSSSNSGLNGVEDEGLSGVKKRKSSSKTKTIKI